MSQSLISILLSEDFVVLGQGGPSGPMSLTSGALGVEGAGEGLKSSFETVRTLPGASAFVLY